MTFIDFRNLFEDRDLLIELHEANANKYDSLYLRQLKKVEKFLMEVGTDEDSLFLFELEQVIDCLKEHFKRLQVDIEFSINQQSAKDHNDRVRQKFYPDYFVKIDDREYLFLATVLSYKIDKNGNKHAYIDFRKLLLDSFFRTEGAKKLHQYRGVTEVLWGLMEERFNNQISQFVV